MCSSDEKWQRIHPLLRGGQPPQAHCFDDRQMEALAAICDTLVPSLPIEAMSEADDNDHTAAFFRASASNADVPTKAAGMIWSYLDASLVRVVAISLWLLSTRLGTLLLCGWAALDWGRFPFVHRFAVLPPIARERVLLSWATGRINQLQSLFKLFKSFTLWAFYSKACSSGCNEATWGAIGYRSPDPSWDGLGSGTGRDPYPLPPPPPPPRLRVVDAAAAAASAATATMESLQLDCDVVVVGSGAGGGAMAAALAAAGRRVVVLDKGGYYPGDQLSLLEGPTMEQMYEGGGVLSTANGSLNLLAATTVGGGTAVNWAAALRTPAQVAEEWAAHGLALLTSQEYRDAMDRVCERLGVTTMPCCNGGEECGEGVMKESFQNAVLRRGCEKLGYEVEGIPRNVRGQRHDCGLCGLGCRSRQKQSTAETWLADAVAAGANILARCEAKRVTLTGDSVRSKRWRAGGVEAIAGDKRVIIRAKATVVACGALQTPVLLQRSGLKNANIGRGLRVHPTAIAWGYFPPGVGFDGTCFDGPIMTSLCRVPGRCGDGAYGCILETPSLMPGAFAALSPWEGGAEHKRRMLRYSRTAQIIAITRDGAGGGGGGTVKAARSGGVIPWITYELSREDEESIKAGVEKGLRILIAAGAREVGTLHPQPETLNLEESKSEEEVEAFLSRVRSKGLRSAAVSIASAHQMGSCRMGVDPAISAVDPSGETWEAEGLFVADASLFPTAVGVNPMITIQSLALCVAKRVDSYLKRV